MKPWTSGPAADEAEEIGPDTNARGGIQALDAALTVLRALAAFPGPVALTDLARATGMPASKVHRYLASFVHAGFAVQRERSGRYDLGPFATAFGLAALARSEFVNRTADRLEELSTGTGLTALLTVWGSNGATVVRWERAASPVITSFGLGSRLPLLTSASGRVFLAFLPRRLTADAVLRERGDAQRAQIPLDFEPSEAGIDALADRVRSEGTAIVDGRFIPGLRAASAPVTNWQGEAEAAVTLIGTREDILDPQGAVRERLARFTAGLSLARAG